jgi:hypothetical protein
MNIFIDVGAEGLATEQTQPDCWQSGNDARVARPDERVLGHDFDAPSYILGSHWPTADRHTTFPDFKKQGTDLLDQLSYSTFLCKIPFTEEEVSAWGTAHQ